MLWNTDPLTHRSVRSPAFYGPVTLAAALTTVSLFSTPVWSQFGLLEAKALNTTLLVGGYGACIKINNNTGLIGPDRFCSDNNLGFTLNVNMNDTFFTNWPTGQDLTSAQILGTQPYADTTSVVPILSSGQTSLQWLHIITAIFALLNVLSLFVPPRWINGGKGKLADFQRSGILTLVLSGITMILAFVTFACVFSLVVSGKNALNAIEGISANWPSSAAFWFILPSGILFIPALLVVLMPVYVKPDNEDEDPNFPDHTPLVNKPYTP
ncbi:hypothetical protein P389DRAFT_166131 [Cystobasidium minutum MCA 4210]|uniref:uncharacterized protein n=1 Tax=Cystobasidium minutum MCA 4210 TaxID=1397322 RepID=UPI0034CE5C37|eukprot:jgi/Rhomi1/166131/fgenesh1_kg.1_\